MFAKVWTPPVETPPVLVPFEIPPPLAGTLPPEPRLVAPDVPFAEFDPGSEPQAAMLSPRPMPVIHRESLFVIIETPYRIGIMPRSHNSHNPAPVISGSLILRTKLRSRAGKATSG